MGISRFYAGKNLFITGVTGFVGKVLLEKMLRQCPNVGGIYCLVRTKQHVAPNVRLQEILNSELFKPIKDERPELLDKVHEVCGDITRDGFGLAAEARAHLEKNINVVFHIAANVKFVDKISNCVRANVLGVSTMLELAKNMANLKAYVHMSTTYCNPDMNILDASGNCITETKEQVYDFPVQPNQMLDAIRWLDDDAIEELKPWLFHGLPNPYAFSKRLGENLLAKEGRGLPLAIVRPSVITSTWREPVPGWVDNLLAIGSPCAELIQGKLRLLPFRHDAIGDCIPADLVINATLASAWHIATHPPPQNPRVYHFATSTQNPCTWGEFFESGFLGCKHYRRRTVLPRICPKLDHNRKSFAVWKQIYHVIPARIADFFRMLSFKSPRVLGSYQRMTARHEGLASYFRQTYYFSTDNMIDMWNSLSATDKKDFPFDSRMMEWTPYVINYFRGIAYYILKYEGAEKPSADVETKSEAEPLPVAAHRHN